MTALIFWGGLVGFLICLVFCTVGGILTGSRKHYTKEGNNTKFIIRLLPDTSLTHYLRITPKTADFVAISAVFFSYSYGKSA